MNPLGGILLGNVVATSGAAANPNMGYHTSTALSALLSVFNVRLGRWCGNPRHRSAWRKVSPRFGGLALINEVFGMMNSRSSFLNISDGGHFENLGIYELVRRRCRIVVAVDAGCDRIPSSRTWPTPSQMLDGFWDADRNRPGGDCGPKASPNAANRTLRWAISTTRMRRSRAC